MRVEVCLPDMGEDAEDEANVACWLVGVGDEVAVGDDLVELTTDKAAFTVPSPRKGVVAELLVEEGENVGVGDPLCILDV